MSESRKASTRDSAPVVTEEMIERAAAAIRILKPIGGAVAQAEVALRAALEAPDA